MCSTIIDAISHSLLTIRRHQDIVKDGVFYGRYWVSSVVHCVSFLYNPADSHVLQLEKGMFTGSRGEKFAF
jgi:hypothetical protein